MFLTGETYFDPRVLDKLLQCRAFDVHKYRLHFFEVTFLEIEPKNIANHGSKYWN